MIIVVVLVEVLGIIEDVCITLFRMSKRIAIHLFGHLPFLEVLRINRSIFLIFLLSSRSHACPHRFLALGSGTNLELLRVPWMVPATRILMKRSSRVRKSS